MERTRVRVGFSVAAVMLVIAMLGFVGSASAHTSCAQIGTVYGIPPWGFHTGAYSGESWFAKGHGTILMSVQHHLVHWSHYAMMWGYPGNIMKIKFRITSSSDPKCTVGMIGRATIFGSYNGVRSQSVQFFFPGACKDQNRVYHGTKVNVQVPPPCIAPRPACVASRRGR